MGHRQHGNHLVGRVGRNVFLTEFHIGTQALVAQHHTLRSTGCAGCVVDDGEVLVVVGRVTYILPFETVRIFLVESRLKVCHCVLDLVVNAPEQRKVVH